MRLIDADVLSEYIKEEIKQDRPDDFKIRNIQRIIEDMPTAYNVENVVERLNTMYDNYAKRKKESYEEQDWENFDIFSHTNEGIYMSINIVKNGYR